MSESKEFISNVEQTHDKVMAAYTSLFLLSSVGRAKVVSLIPMYDAQGLTNASRRVKSILPLLDQFDRWGGEGGDDGLQAGANESE